MNTGDKTQTLDTPMFLDIYELTQMIRRGIPPGDNGMKVTKTTKMHDNDTGEVLYEKQESVREYIFTHNGYMVKGRFNGAKIMYNTEWPISRLDRNKWLDLLPYLDKDNALMRKDRPKHGLTVPLISPIIELSENKTYQWMRRMLDSQMVIKSDGVFYVNPLYVMAYNRISPELYRIFENHIKPHVPSWVPERYEQLKGESNET